MRRITMSALALLGSLAVTGVARAGCCDDFWSCAAAVATGGVSCQIQSIIDSVNAMKQLVETMGNTLRNQANNITAQASKAVSDATNELKQLRVQAMTDLQNHATRAHDIANPPKTLTMAPTLAGGAALQKGAIAKPVTASPGAVAGALQPAPVVKTSIPGAPKVADAQAIKDSLARADAFMQDLRSKANAPANQVAQAEAAAITAALRHLQTAQQISLDLAITPLNLLRDSLLDLLTHPERLFDPTAQITADVQRITAQVPAMLDRITNEVTQEAIGDLNQVKGTLQQLQDAAASAQALVDTMQKVANSKLQSDLDALDRLVPKPAPGVAPPSGMAIASTAILLPPAVAATNRQLVAVAFTHADPAKLPLVIQQRAAVADIAAKWQNVQALVKTPVKIEPATVQKVDHDLGQMYVGKSKADITKKKNELREEAKKRFASDPKTLEKVLQYVETHSPRD